MEDVAALHWADILVFTAVIVVSTAIGLYYAVRARMKSAEELLLGQRKLPVLPVMFSLSVSFISAVSVLGIPADIYANGSDYWMVGFGFIWSILATGIVILPVIYRLKLTSAYEYLELRFSRPVRLMASFTFIFLMVCYMAVVLYAPALALSSVTELSMEISILTIGLVCTIYTALGGIKAVIWTDMFQTLIITAGLLALIGRGIIESGGVDETIKRIVNGSRDATYSMDFNPFVRHTFWTLTIGGGIGNMALVGANQATLQRYLSVETLNRSRLVLLSYLPLSELYLALLCLNGLVMYAYYQGRDPLVSGRIQKRDQLVPLFVLDVLGQWPGLPGLMIACVFSAALSTVSSGVNSLATVTVEDFIKPTLVLIRGTLPSPRAMSIIVISTALFFGLLTIGAAYLCGVMSSALLTIAISFLGMMGGPVLGVMLNGLLCPWVNSWGAGSGLVSSLAITMWTAIGAIIKPRPSAQPTNGTIASAENSDSFDVYDWYDLSYQHYATLALIVSVVVGTLVSLATKCNKGKNLRRDTYFDTLRPCRRGDPQEMSYDLKQESNPQSGISGNPEDSGLTYVRSKV